MKKVLFIMTFVLGGVIGMAQEINPQNGDTTKQVVTTHDGYTEIKVEDLTGEINMALGKNYPKTNIDKAYWNEKNQKYKLEVSKEGGESATLFLDREGNFVKE